MRIAIKRTFHLKFPISLLLTSVSWNLACKYKIQFRNSFVIIFFSNLHLENRNSKFSKIFRISPPSPPRSPPISSKSFEARKLQFILFRSAYTPLQTTVPKFWISSYFFRNLRKFKTFFSVISTKSLKPKFKSFVVVLVEGDMLIRIQKTHSSFKTLGGVRSGSLKLFFFCEASLKVFHAVRACKLHTLRNNVTNVTIYGQYNITIRYAYNNITIYAYWNAYYITLNIHAYYKATIRYDITLLMTLFYALLIAAGFWKFDTMFFLSGRFS